MRASNEESTPDSHRVVACALLRSEAMRRSAAEDYALFLGEIEKLVLAMNEEAAKEARDGSEA